MVRLLRCPRGLGAFAKFASWARLARSALWVPLAVWAFAGAASAQPTTGLDLALRTALAQHPALAGKRAQVDAKGYAGEAARSLRYPSLSAVAQRVGGAPRNAVGASGSTTPVSLRARQPLWAFGRIDSQIAYADADTQSERTDLRRLQRQVIENTAQAYLNVLAGRERLQLSRDNTAAHQRLHDQILRREKGQLASRADVNLAATRLAQAQAREQRYEGDLDVALGDLLALTQTPVPADQPLGDNDTTVPGADAVLEMALARNAEVRHKHQLVERARAALEQTRTASMPTVYLQADRGSDLANSAYSSSDRRVSVVLEGTLEGLGVAASGRTKGAAAQLNAAQQDLLSTENDTRRSVRRLVGQRQTQQALIATQATSLQDLRTLVDSYRRQYEAGAKSWLDLLNILRETSDQLLQQVQAETDWRAQSLQIKALIGGFDALIGATD